MELTLAQTVELVNDAQSKAEGIWVRLHTDLKICLIGVQDADTGKFVAKFFPCANNSRTYPCSYKDIRELEKTESGETPLRYTRADNYRAQFGA